MSQSAVNDVHPKVRAVYERVVSRSTVSRAAYLKAMQYGLDEAPRRSTLSCSNLAHTYAAMNPKERASLIDSSTMAEKPVNLGIVTAYNDMLSAHQPYGAYPDAIKAMARTLGAHAQVAGGVPAMCDGITQGQSGMELSLFSRDVIAQSVAIALSHAAFDAVLCLGICDKIVPGMLMGALAFGYLPVLFLPSGPMPTGMSNQDKSLIRQRYAKGEIDSQTLLDAELKCYHSAGTCTFYGTANTNELMLECLGLQLAGSSFPNPESDLRTALNQAAVTRAVGMARDSDACALFQLIDERAIINAMLGILASGGSTNHTLHMVSIARAAGIQITWDDFQALSEVTPLLARVYPNGDADVNTFHAHGGIQHIVAELAQAGLLFTRCNTVMGIEIGEYSRSPVLEEEKPLAWRRVECSPNDAVLRPWVRPFSPTGGVVLLEGNLGRAIIKSSAVDPVYHQIEAPAMIFESQGDFIRAFKAGELTGNMVVVIRFQGPRANGMPELHQLMPTLAVMQERGQKVALVTDGRLSGASGKVAAAIHCVPEASVGGALSKLKSGDRVRLDIKARVLKHFVDAGEWSRRSSVQYTPSPHPYAGALFEKHRALVASAEEGGSLFH